MAQQAEKPVLAAKVLVNRLRLLPRLDKDAEMPQAMIELRDMLSRLGAGRAKTDVLLNLGELLNKGGKTELPDTAQAGRLAAHAFREALAEAGERGDSRALALADGGLANLYEQQARLDDAHALNRQALFYVHQGYHPEIEYLRHWQQARLLRAEGKTVQAIAAFRAAIDTLDEVRSRLNEGYRLRTLDFDTQIRPVYYGLADLYLLQAAAAGEARQNLLKDAVDAVEQMKTAELQNYFRNECLVRVDPQEGEARFSDTALVYPLPLADRLEVLVGIDGVWRQLEPRAVDADTVNHTAATFRRTVQDRSGGAFLQPAAQLYDWLIRPALAELRAREIGTLLFLPDGALRQIPPAALYDGKAFLIEEFAVVTAPSLGFLDPTPLDWHNSGMLVAGLSDAVQNYPPLPGVVKEVETIQKLTRSDVIFNREYTTASLENKLRAAADGYSVLHLATHGEFDADPNYTYVLTYEEKMRMDQLDEIVGLGNYRKQPLELLVLSACKTAVGDDRAALGLAGVAIQAGARSAVASLWFVDDEATKLTMQGFYRELFTAEGTTKARALQKVQKSLLEQSRYRHPAYWAPFLLIGNWL